MKLYTEKQLKKAIELAQECEHECGGVYFDYTEKEIIDELTPIELPSDEEVEQYLKSFPYTKHLDDGQYNDGKIAGAELAIQWMRDKILGGNK